MKPHIAPSYGKDTKKICMRGNDLFFAILPFNTIDDTGFLIARMSGVNGEPRVAEEFVKTTVLNQIFQVTSRFIEQGIILIR